MWYVTFPEPPWPGTRGTISGSMKTIHSHLRGDIEHGWRCGILQPNISSCLEGFPNRCGLDERKGPMIFGAIFGHEKQASVGLVSWLVAPYRSRTKMAIGDTVQMVVWKMYLLSNMVMSGFYVKFWGVPLLQVRTSMVSPKSKDLLRNTSQVCCIPKQEAYVCLVNS